MNYLLGVVVLITVSQVGAGDYIQREALMQSDVVQYVPGKQHFVTAFEIIDEDQREKGTQIATRPPVIIMQTSGVTNTGVDQSSSVLNSFFNTITFGFFEK